MIVTKSVIADWDSPSKKVRSATLAVPDATLTLKCRLISQALSGSAMTAPSGTVETTDSAAVRARNIRQKVWPVTLWGSKCFQPNVSKPALAIDGSSNRIIPTVPIVEIIWNVWEKSVWRKMSKSKNPPSASPVNPIRSRSFFFDFSTLLETTNVRRRAIVQALPLVLHPIREVSCFEIISSALHGSQIREDQAPASRRAIPIP
jgi:hypothetical protein